MTRPELPQPATPLKRQAATSVFWVGVAMVFARAIGALRKLILAKLLLPSDFGLVAIAVLAIDALQFLRELGFGSALIHRQEDVEEASHTAFWVILLSSLPLYAIAFLAAEPLMLVFNKEVETVRQAVPVLRALALTMVISSIGEVPIILLAKELNFRQRIIPQMWGAFAGGLLSISLALAGLGVWSMVSGYLFETAVAATVIWFISPWRPRWRFNTRIAREMFGYGRNIAASRVLVFFITNIDDAFVSKMLGLEPLGQYGFAYDLSNLPATQITRLVGQVMFPAFSKVQHDLHALREIYLKSTRYVSLVAVPVAICIIAFAPEFIHGVYDEPWWAPTVLPIQLLGIYGLMRSIAANMGSVFQAGGKPQWLVRIALLRLGVMVAGLYPATRYYGIVGVSALSAAVAVVDFVISMVLSNRIIDLPSAKFLRMLWPILGGSLAAAVVAKLAHPWLTGLPIWVSLPLAGVVMAVVYGALMWALDAEVRGLARTIWGEAKRRGRALGSRRCSAEEPKA